MASLTVGLLKGQLVVLLPGSDAFGVARHVPLPTGKAEALLVSILKAQEAGELGIETKAEPTETLAFHMAHHSRVPVDTCAHCRAESAARDATKVKRYGPRGGRLNGRAPQRPMTVSEMLAAIADLPPEERAATIRQLMGDL